jgi:uncharacterized protein YutE (UPF0331/DUF86 family)
MDELLSRLKRLEENLRELERFQGTTLADLEDSRRTTWALRYGLMESIQATIDIACALVSRHNLGYPDSYADCFRILRRHDVLSNELVERLIQAVGMRNVLVHEYQEVNDALVLDALDRLSDFRLFAEEIRSSGSTFDDPPQ